MAEQKTQATKASQSKPAAKNGGKAEPKKDEAPKRDGEFQMFTRKGNRAVNSVVKRTAKIANTRSSKGEEKRSVSTPGYVAAKLKLRLKAIADRGHKEVTGQETQDAVYAALAKELQGTYGMSKKDAEARVEAIRTAKPEKLEPRAASK